jgi:hypothetical protein
MVPLLGLSYIEGRKGTLFERLHRSTYVEVNRGHAFNIGRMIHRVGKSNSANVAIESSDVETLK